MTGHSSLRLIIRKISSSFSRMKVCHSATHTTHEWRFQLDQVGFFAEFDCCGYRAVLVVGALCGVVTVGELDDCFLPALLLSFPLILLFVACGYSIIGRGCGRGGGCGCGCGCCCCCSHKSRLANAQAVVATILINVSSNTQTLTGHVSGLSKQLVRIKKTWVYVGLNIWSLLSLFVETRPYTRDSRHSLAVVCSIGFWLKFILHADTEPIRQDPSTMADAGNSTLEFPFWHGKALHGYPISASPVERINRSSHTPSGAKTIVVWRCVKFFFFCSMTLLFCLIAFVVWMQHWSKKVLLVCSTLANVKAIQGRRLLLHGMENAGCQTPCSSGSSLKHTEEAESWLIRLDLETTCFSICSEPIKRSKSKQQKVFKMIYLYIKDLVPSCDIVRKWTWLTTWSWGRDYPWDLCQTQLFRKIGSSQYATSNHFLESFREGPWFGWTFGRCAAR